MARPTKPDDERLENFTVRLSKKDRATIEANAGKIGLSPSEFLRVSGLRGTVRVVKDGRKADPALLNGLIAVGNNLNQIAHRANETKEAPDSYKLSAALADLYNVFIEIREAHRKP